jgi:hypothetical protein
MAHNKFKSGGEINVSDENNRDIKNQQLLRIQESPEENRCLRQEVRVCTASEIL